MVSDDLVGVSDIAERLGVTPAAVSNWHKRHDTFPQPAMIIGKRPAWIWADVVRWNEDRGSWCAAIGSRLDAYRVTVSPT